MLNKAQSEKELRSTLMVFKGYPSNQKGPVLKRMVTLLKTIEKKSKDYVKSVFKAATSFEDFSRKFSGKLFGQFGVSKNANLDVCNEAAEAMLDVNDRFEVGAMLDFFGNVKPSPFRGSKMPKNANAVYRRVFGWGGQLLKDGIMLPVSITSSSVKAQKARNNEAYNKELEKVKAWIQAHAKISDEVKEKSKDLKQWRWVISTDFKGTTYHEMGHKLHLGEDVNNIDPLVREGYNMGWATVLSEYAKTNHKEYFAEAFCAYMLGEHEFIEPRLLAKLKELDRAA